MAFSIHVFKGDIVNITYFDQQIPEGLLTILSYTEIV